MEVGSRMILSKSTAPELGVARERLPRHARLGVHRARAGRRGQPVHGGRRAPALRAPLPGALADRRADGGARAPAGATRGAAGVADGAERLPADRPGEPHPRAADGVDRRGQLRPGAPQPRRRVGDRAGAHGTHPRADPGAVRDAAPVELSRFVAEGSTTNEARPLRGDRRRPRGGRPTGRSRKPPPWARPRASPRRHTATTPRRRRSSRRRPRPTRSSPIPTVAPSTDRYGFEGLDSRGFSSASHGFGSFSDIFDAFFGGYSFGAFGGRGGSGRVQGGDVAVEVEIMLDQAASGTAAEVAYDLVDACERCHGSRAEPGALRRAPAAPARARAWVRAVSRTAFGQLVREQVCSTLRRPGEHRLRGVQCV